MEMDVEIYLAFLTGVDVEVLLSFLPVAPKTSHFLMLLLLLIIFVVFPRFCCHLFGFFSGVVDRKRRGESGSVTSLVTSHSLSHSVNRVQLVG